MNKIEIFREATQKIVKILSDKNIKITQRGIKAFVKYDERSGKPVQVNIPFIPDNATDDLLNAIQGFIDHEVAHILFTDFKVLKNVATNHPKAQGLYNIIEDSFIERKMAKQFVGSGLNLRNVGEFFLRTFTDKALAEKPEETVAVLLVPAIRAWAGQHVYIDYMKDKWHLMQQVVDALGDAVKDVAKCERSQDCLDLAVKFQNLLEKAPENPENEDTQESDSKQKSDKPGSSKDKKSKSGEKPEQKTEKSDEKADSRSDDEPKDESDKSDSDEDDSGQGDGGSDENDEGADQEKGKGKSSSGDGSSEEEEDGEGEDEGDPTLSGGSADPAEGDVEDKSSTSIMDALANLKNSDFDQALADELTKATVEGISETDYFVYTKDFDVIKPLDTQGYDVSYQLTDMLKTVDHMVGPLQKDLERAIAAKSKSVWVPGHRSGKLNGSSLARLVAFNDGRAFRRRHESTSKDVAVSLLVDCSGSMTQSGKIRIAAHAAYALSSVLERIGVTHEVLGFTTGGSLSTPPVEEREAMAAANIVSARHAKLYIPIIKEFKDRVTPETKNRFAYMPIMSGMNENVDGESVDIAANRLAKCSQARKILIVLSDGQPACGGGSKALRNHLKKTVKNVEKSGIDVLGIGILSEAVSEFYSKHIVLKSVQDLPGAVIKEIKRLLIKN